MIKGLDNQAKKLNYQINQYPKKSLIVSLDVGCCSFKLYRLFQTPHSFSVTIFTLGFRLFFILLQINLT
jgi:hypothetical protein